VHDCLLFGFGVGAYFVAWKLEQRNLCGDLRFDWDYIGHFCGAESMKGKPWTREQEKQLRELVKAGGSLKAIAAELKKSIGAVKAKMQRLGLEVVVPMKKSVVTTTSLELPTDLPSVEEQMLVLAGALKELQKGGLDKSDVMRLRSIIAGVKAYKELFADYVDYRGIEQKVEEAVKWLRRLEQERKSMERKKG
jgi:hypothetical protein